MLFFNHTKPWSTYCYKQGQKDLQMLTVLQFVRAKRRSKRYEESGRLKRFPALKKNLLDNIEKTDPIHSSLGMVSGIPEMRTDLKQKQRLNLACRLQGQNT